MWVINTIKDTGTNFIIDKVFPPAQKSTWQTVSSSSSDKKVSSDNDSSSVGSWNNAGVQPVFGTYTQHVASAISKFLCHIAGVDVEEFDTVALRY